MQSRLLYAMRIFPRRRMWLSLMGIMVCAILFFGVLSVVYWLSFSSSAYFGEEEGIYVLASEEAATVKQSQVPLALAPALARMQGIEVVCPELFIYGVLNDKAVIIRGIFPSDFQELEPVEMLDGRWLRDDDIKGAIAGVNLAKKLELRVNDSYVLSGSEVNDFITVRIVGIFQGGGMIDDDLLMNMHYARFLQSETKQGYASIIRAKVNTEIWPSVESVWESVSGPPNVTELQFHPTGPNNTQKVRLWCNATAYNQIGSVLLHYRKKDRQRVFQKTMNQTGEISFETEIGPVKDSPWIVCWAEAIDILGHESETKAINLSITDALGPDIFDLTIEPPPPQTKDDELNVSFKIFDSSELVRNVTVHTYSAGQNLSFSGQDSTGGAYKIGIGRYSPGRLILRITARDRFDNLGSTAYYSYRILNRTDQAPPDIGEIIYEPVIAYDNSTVNLTVPIVDESNITTAELMIDYQIKGVHFNATLALNRSTEQEDLWTAVTGPFNGSTTVHYRIYARDLYGNARYSETTDVEIRYSEPPEQLYVYRFPAFSPPGLNNLLFMVLYDAAEIKEVNITFLDRGRWTNISFPVGITTFREPLLLGKLGPGTKQYVVSFEDRRGDISSEPAEGMASFLVESWRPIITDVEYSPETAPGRPVKVTFSAFGAFPLSHVSITDGRGVIRECELQEEEYMGIVGPYEEPGTYTFTITAQDSAGNTQTEAELPLTVLPTPITDIDFSPKPPILGEDLTVTCRILGDSPGNEVDLIAPVGGRYVATDMDLVQGTRTATIPVNQTGIIPFSIQTRVGDELIRSDTLRVAVGEAGSSIYVSHRPDFPTSSEGISIDIWARNPAGIDLLQLRWRNGTEGEEHQRAWSPGGTDFSTSFEPGTQLGTYLDYRVTVWSGGRNLTYPPTADEWIRIPVARNTFDPPILGPVSLSPRTYIGRDGKRAEDFLIHVGITLVDMEGIDWAEVRYEVEGRDYAEPLLPVRGRFDVEAAQYSAYLGPFPTNQTIKAQVTAQDISGLQSVSPEIEYTLSDTYPPVISGLYHDPLNPEPQKRITIGCEVTDDSGVKDVLLHYGGNWTDNVERMTKYGDTYTLELISPPAGQTLSYAVEATDNYGNTNLSRVRTVRSRDENPPVIWEVGHEPPEPTDKESVNITVRLLDREDEVENVTLHWYQYTWRTKTLEGGKGFLTRVFRIDASEFDPGMDVRYKIEAFDRSGNKAVYPSAEQVETPPSPIMSGGSGELGQEAWDPYLTFRVVDMTPPSIALDANPTDPNELQTVTFTVEASDNHLLSNFTLHLYVGGDYRPYQGKVGRPEFMDEFSSGALEPGSSLIFYLEVFDRSGNYARYPTSGNLTITVRRFEWGGQIASIDPRIELEVAGPAGFSQDMARQGAGKIITSINGILFMTFLATVAGIGNIVYTSIFKSKREIGLLRTLGGSKKFVTALVASLTVVIGLVAAIVGCVLAYILLTTFSSLGATLAWVTLKPTFNLLLVGATSAAAITISLFGGMVALTRLFSYTPVESIRTVTPPEAKREYPTYIETTKRFSYRTVGLLLLLLICTAGLIRIYPTYISDQPFDPDSWLHLKVAGDMRETGHLDLSYDSRELQAVSALPGLNILLVFSQRLTGAEMLPARILPPLVSSLGLVFIFVLARRVSKSTVVGAVAAVILAVVGFYANRTAALTKESVALQLLIFSVFVLYVGHTLRNGKYKFLLFPVSVALMLTHHLTSIYFILIFVGYVALRNLEKYSQGVFDPSEAKQDLLAGAAVLAGFTVISLTLGRYETQIPFQDALLIVSLFFVSIGFGRLILASSYMERHRRVITLAIMASLVVFPYFAYRAGLFSYAPWEQVLPMIAPHLGILALAVLALYPVSILSENQQSFLLAYASAIVPFLLFGIVKRDVFAYILLFRNIPYGYQLSAILAGITFVYAYKRLEAEYSGGIRTLAVSLGAVILMVNLLFASYMGFLSQDYERKDLYDSMEYSAALHVNRSTLRGQLVGADERARRLLLYVTGEDGDQITTYVYLIRMEKYLINRLRDQVEMTDRPLTHVFAYQDMYEVGFVDTVLFKDVPRIPLNRFEDVIFDNGEDELIYIARKEWP